MDIGARRALLAVVMVFVALGGALVLQARPVVPPANATTVLPAPELDEPSSGRPASETAVLAGGCFWGVQGVFQHVEGVTQAVSGYAGGTAETASYETVGSGTTGHAESVRITYDPNRVSYGQLLRVFFAVGHDPTELNRQGPDTGPQYRSAIFPQDDMQQKVADAYVAQLNRSGFFDAPVVTAVSPGARFFAAEDYHQDFLADNPTYPYIVVNDAPKIDALKATFPDLYRSEPVLVRGATS